MFAMLKWLFLLALTLVIAGFSVVNRHLVTIGFYPLPFEIELPVYLLILLTFFAGFSAAWFLARLKVWRKSGQLSREKRRSGALEEEVARLKHQPSTNSL